MVFENYYIVGKLNETSEYIQRVTQITHEVCEELQLKEVAVPNKQTLIIAIGGDGTMMHAMKEAAFNGSTAVGMNLGRVGFLTDINVRNFPHEPQLKSFLRQVITSEKSSILERMLLTSGDMVAVNEFSIAGSRADAMVEYDLFIDDFHAGSHRANSVLVSTPTGSTAYSLSAGGALLFPTMDAIQITPVAPLSMTSRPIIVPASSEVRVETKSRGWFNADGQQQFFFETANGGKAVFRIGKFGSKAKVLHNEGWNHFSVLKEKLGWNYNQNS